MLESSNHEYIFHFSVDDTIDCFKDISEVRYDSIFDNEFFGWLKKLHDEYGVVTTCYVFYEDSDFSLVQTTDRYREEFRNNSDWLRFGFHTIDSETTYDVYDIERDYIKTIKELERIVGSETIDNIIRLQSYQGSYENIKVISEVSQQPVTGLLASDDKRDQYYFDNELNGYIYSHDLWQDDDLGIIILSTDIRVENVQNVNRKLREFDSSAWYNQMNILEIFSHEWALNLDVKAKTEEFCVWAKDRGYLFAFPEDILLSD